ncbi:hypothetical protein EIP91_000391 [Steccherinum ochraceum]|uniref:Uncharacterized protein n=1 Tax=Steccherinum ochraceum TaxID=92696 RepID=A0A4R0RMG6_9APHY|nr:hypothetical protein EIP91_000391 [Steccherinum ochraceum]
MRLFTTAIAVTALDAAAVMAVQVDGAAHSNYVRQLQRLEDYHLHRRFTEVINAVYARGVHDGLHRRDNQPAYMRRDFGYPQKRAPTASDLDSGSESEPERTSPLQPHPQDALHGSLWGDRDIPPKSPVGGPAPSNTSASRATTPLGPHEGPPYPATPPASSPRTSTDAAHSGPPYPVTPPPADDARRTQRKDARKQEAQAGPSTREPVAQSKPGPTKKPGEQAGQSKQDVAAFKKQLKQDKKDEKAAAAQSNQVPAEFKKQLKQDKKDEKAAKKLAKVKGSSYKAPF